MEIIRISEVPTKTNPRGLQVKFLVERPDVAVVGITLEPGGVMEKHVTPVDVLFHITEGRGTMLIGDEDAEVKAGDIVVSPAHIPHGFKAATDEVLSVLVIKTPNPAKK